MKRTSIEILDAFIEYSDNVKKYHDSGNFKFIKADIESMKMEIEADNRNVNNLMDQVDSLGKELLAGSVLISELDERRANLVKHIRGQQLIIKALRPNNADKGEENG